MIQFAFEEGNRVPIADFDYESFDMPIVNVKEEEIKREAHKLLSQMLSHFFQKLQDAPNPKCWLDCFQYACQLTELSEVELAAKHKITKQAISKMVVQITDIFNLPPARGMRSMEARETFSQKQKCLHQRKRELRQNP